VVRPFVGAVAVVAVTFGFGGTRAAAFGGDAQAQALLAKHREYVGWQFGDGTFRSMRISGTVTGADGEKIEAFVTLSKGLAYRTSTTLIHDGGIVEQSGFTGNLFWHSDLNGFTTPIFGDYAKFLASATVLQLEGTTELPASFVETKTIDGKAVDVVRVTLTNGDPIDLAIDPQSGAYVQATIDPEGAYETTYHIVSYRDALPGKKVIGSFRIDEEKSIRSLVSVEPNGAVTDQDLHPPAPSASWTYGDSEPAPITLTRHRILVDATVNGVKGRFILDTGANAIVLDETFADRAKAPAFEGHSQASTMRGPVQTRVRRTDTIAFGSATLHNALVFSEDFRAHDFFGLDRAEYAGLIGYDLFADAVVKLDVYGSKMTILDPSTDLSETRGIALLVDLSQGVPAIPMTLNKTIAVNAFLDTGNPGIIFFGPELVKKRHLKIFAGCGNIDSLTIGPITYAGQAACEWGFAANDMLLGFDFLKHFDYVFDYPHGRMFMTPNKN
jgi:predicted aspartyl protease